MNKLLIRDTLACSEDLLFLISKGLFIWLCYEYRASGVLF